MSTEAKSSNEKFEDLAIAEEASPISSRPPAAATATATATAASSSSRWPRQETLALLQIRSEMDAAFRDAATLKAPLWEYVSRKLEEQGYKRSAKKCKEKFENVQKYYKRTKEGQVGRQDGKSYKFFTQLDALHQNTNLSAYTNTNTNIVPILPLAANPAATFSMRSQDQPQAPASHDHQIINIIDHQPPVSLHAAAPASTAIGISFSSSSSQREGDDEDDEEEEEMESAQHRKRKRSHGNDSDQRMMEFFEGLMRQVMQKQEAMQLRFLEAIEKREQDRMIREEAWKRQDMARLGREQELMSQERAISASRDAAIIAFLQKITGQTIHLPTTVARDPAPPLTVSQLPPPFLPHELQQQQPTFQQQKQSQNQNYRVHEQNPQEFPSSQNIKVTIQHQPNTSNSEVVTAIPEQLVTSREVISSRWPKLEVLALIQLRSGLESRYQEAGPKGPLWEDISAGMLRMGFNRNAKRCKEKWENINKYFKKVKESNKKRPEDAKTCPYFHELDALYHKKILGNTGNAGGSSSGDINILGNWPEPGSQNKDGGNSELQTSSTLGVTASSLSREQSQMGTIEGAKQQPEDIVRKQHQERYEKLDYNFCDDSNSDKENEEDNDEDDVDENEVYDFDENEEEMKLSYKTQFKNRENIGSDGISIYHNHGSVRGQPASIAN